MNLIFHLMHHPSHFVCQHLIRTTNNRDKYVITNLLGALLKNQRNETIIRTSYNLAVCMKFFQK